MRQIVVRTSYHRHSDKPDYNRVYRVPDGQDPVLFTLVREMQDEFGLESLDQGQIAATLSDARDCASREGRVVLNSYGEPVEFMLQCDSCDAAQGTAKLAVWPVGHTREVVFLDVAPYQPNQQLRAQLQELSHQELLEQLLVVYAEQGNLPLLRSE